ncbi:MAG TPA: hypothetical protein VK789_28385 [Bryobacteraceae bacterium]|jgi:hypothetical protein|nr:hypothetical protein [Bryobacteraceae bacterium]
MPGKRPRLIVIPFQINAREYSLFIALDDQSVERIKAYDPAQVEMGKLPPLWTNLRLNTILVGYATNIDVARITEMLQGADDPRKALQFLSRGFAFKPDQGDYDGPYLDAQAKEGDTKQ